MSEGVKVFVGNLPDRCPESSLQDLFSPYGKIKGIIMVKTYAFIHFEFERDAKKAVDDLHKSKLLGKELTVEVAKSKPATKRGQPMEKRSKNTGLSFGSMGPGGMGGGIGGGMGGGMGGPMGPCGILGMGPGGPGSGLPNAALGLLNAVTAVKNIAGAVGQNPDQNSILPLPNSASNNRDTSRDRAPPPSDGYVIYERFYVDRSHPLLKGLPVPELPRVQDVIANRDTFKKDPYAQDVSIRDDPYTSTTTSNRNDDYGGGYQTRRDDTSNVRDDYFTPRRDDAYPVKRENVDSFRERSPLYSRREYDRDTRSRGYDDYDRR